MKNLIENNKLIAKFMGSKTSGYKNIWLPKIGVCRWDTVELGKGKVLKYHKSWDWIIPVVKKIREIINTELNFSDFDSQRSYEQKLSPYNYDIDSIYKDVIEFIKWYNYHKEDSPFHM